MLKMNCWVSGRTALPRVAMGTSSRADFHPTLMTPSFGTTTHFSTVRSSRGTVTLDARSPARIHTCSRTTNFSTTSRVHSMMSLHSFALPFHVAHLQVLETPITLGFRHLGVSSTKYLYIGNSLQARPGRVQPPRAGSISPQQTTRLGIGGPRRLPSHRLSINGSHQPARQLHRGTSLKSTGPTQTHILMGN